MIRVLVLYALKVYTRQNEYKTKKKNMKKTRHNNMNNSILYTIDKMLFS